MFRGIIIALVFVSAPAVATAQEAATGEPAPAATSEAAAPQLPAHYEGKLARGHASYMATDYSAALAAYQAAKDQDAGRAPAYYFMACAMSKLDRHDEAIGLLKTTATIAGEKDQNLHAKALFMIAVVQERKGDWAAAKAAWNEYVSYAKTHGDATTFVPVAEGRIEIIEKKLKLDEDYAPVRERRAKKGS
jgi:tetratricopeptide (TPR) repeat protein